MARLPRAAILAVALALCCIIFAEGSVCSTEESCPASDEPVSFVQVALSASRRDSAVATDAVSGSLEVGVEVKAKSAFAASVHVIARQTEKDLAALWVYLPAALRHLGIKTFGSEEKLRSFLKTLSGPHPLKDDGLIINMFAGAADNTLPRLQQEMSVDQYGINGVLEPNGLIVDIGGNIGDLALTAAKRHPQLQVLTLEPAPTTFFILMLNMYSNDVPMIEEKDLGKADKPGVLALNKGLTSDGRDFKVAVNLNSTQDAHSVSNGDVTLVETGTIEFPVGSLSLPKYLAAHGVETVRLLKMDCEGCEFEAIPSMQGFFEDRSKVQRFSAEIHHFADPLRQPHPNAVVAMDTLLEARGCPGYSIGWWEVKC